MALTAGALMTVALALLSGCLPVVRPSGPPSPAESLLARERLTEAFTEYWRTILPLRPDLGASLGIAGAVLPAQARAASRAAAQLALRLEPELADINAEALAPAEYAALQVLQSELGVLAESYTWYDLDLGALSPRLTPLKLGIDALRRHPLDKAEHVDQYVALLEDLQRWLLEFRRPLEERQAKGVVPSVDVVLVFAGLVGGLRDIAAAGGLAASPTRVAALDTAALARLRGEEARVIATGVVLALDSLRSWLEGPYMRAASARPGLWQLAGGKEYYRSLLRRHTGLGIGPEEAHAIGIATLRRVDSLLAVVGARAGFNPDAASLHDSLRRSLPRQTLDSALGRLGQRIEADRESLGLAFELPDSLPVVRAASALEAWLFPDGQVFAPLRADSATLVIGTPRWIAPDALMEGRAFQYRWGWPGVALAAAGAPLSEVGTPFAVLHPWVATVEGWGEYAASLAGELGLYAGPRDAYGRLLREGLGAALLVVDTGIHYFGWTKPQALLLLRRYSLLPDDQLDGLLVERVIATPGQAGAATLGARELAAMRAWMQGALGARFDARRWHRELLLQGPAPLPVLGRHFEWWEWSQRSTPPE